MKNQKKAYLYIMTDSEEVTDTSVQLFHDHESLKAEAKKDFETVVRCVFGDTDLQYKTDGSIEVGCDDDDPSGYWYDGIGTWSVVNEDCCDYSCTASKVVEIVVSGHGSDTASVAIMSQAGTPTTGSPEAAAISQEEKKPGAEVVVFVHDGLIEGGFTTDPSVHVTVCAFDQDHDDEDAEDDYWKECEADGMQYFDPDIYHPGSEKVE